jgi:hypothetical protein
VHDHFETIANPTISACQLACTYDVLMPVDSANMDFHAKNVATTQDRPSIHLERVQRLKRHRKYSDDLLFLRFLPRPNFWTSRLVNGFAICKTDLI